MRALITGGQGFIGSYMAHYLVSQGHEVVATHAARAAVSGIEVPAEVKRDYLDVRDRSAVRRVLDRHKPEIVYHFAGQPYIIPSWKDPVTTFETNVLGTLNLLEHIARTRPRTQFAFAGSSAAYGTAEVIPTPESSPFRPVSPYASSKAAGDILCLQYFASYKIPVFRFRIYCTSGPGKRGDSLNDFASQIAELERAAPPRVIRVGNLNAQRDFTDVRDSVRAMVRIVEHGEAGEAYNVGSGVPQHIRKTLDALLALARVPIQVETDPGKFRSVDEPVIHADVSRLRGLGWTPEVPFEKTLRDILDWWRTRGVPRSTAPLARRTNQRHSSRVVGRIKKGRSVSRRAVPSSHRLRSTKLR